MEAWIRSYNVIAWIRCYNVVRNWAWRNVRAWVREACNGFRGEWSGACRVKCMYVSNEMYTLYMNECMNG